MEPLSPKSPRDALVKVSSEENKTFAEDIKYATDMLATQKTVHPDEWNISSGKVITLRSGQEKIPTPKSPEVKELK